LDFEGIRPNGGDRRKIGHTEFGQANRLKDLRKDVHAECPPHPSLPYIRHFHHGNRVGHHETGKRTGKCHCHNQKIPAMDSSRGNGPEQLKWEGRKVTDSLEIWGERLP
jgi:hypothetical protein